ncbi:unnamed protein product, partial [Closterium sp. NIES-53]
SNWDVSFSQQSPAALTSPTSQVTLHSFYAARKKNTLSTYSVRYAISSLHQRSD